jgi:hypothetical protein
MTQEEYEGLVQKVVALYQARVEEYAKEMASEQEKDLQAIARVWKLENGEEPPTLTTTARRSVKATTNGHQPTSQKQRIRRIIGGLLGSIDSAKVLKRYGEVYPDEEQPHSSTVSKVFRAMEEEQKLEKVKEAGFQQPAEYVKR